MIKTREVVCNVCKSGDSTFLFNGRDRLHGIEGTFSYVRCKECGLVYMNPQVSPESVTELYPSDYGPHSAGTRGPESKRTTLKSRVKRVPVLRSLFRVLANVKIAGSLYRKLGRESRVLDVGCGGGAFLNEVRLEKGCEVHGVDISERAVREAKESFGLDIFKGNVTEAPFPEEYFDVATAWWYLEHVADPSGAAAGISRLLKRGGCFIVGIPNYESLFARCFGARWYHLDCPRHLYLWTRGTIGRLLSDHGLCITRVVYDKTPWGLLGSLQYLFYGDNLDTRYRNRLRGSRFLWMLLLPWTILISLFRKSDIMVIYAKKTGRNDNRTE
jgi:SAM-dependent methyltransferase